MHKDYPVPMVSKRRFYFLFVDKARIDRQNAALTIKSGEDYIELPCSQLLTLFMGRGTSITHDAVMLCAEMGVQLVWTGDGAVRYYAHGNSIASKSTYGQRQAELVSKRLDRNRVARRMYQIRFPDDVVTPQMSLSQLRGKEGARVRSFYQRTAEKYGVEWQSRNSRMDSIDAGDFYNQAITLATASLYGIVHSVVNAIGAIPSLGFIHAGNRNSFVFDIADLYKMEIAVETAFKVAQNPALTPVIDQAIRSEMRDVFRKEKLSNRIVKDIRKILELDDYDDELLYVDSLFLWDDKGGLAEANKNWSPS